MAQYRLKKDIPLAKAGETVLSNEPFKKTYDDTIKRFVTVTTNNQHGVRQVDIPVENLWDWVEEAERIEYPTPPGKYESGKTTYAKLPEVIERDQKWVMGYLSAHKEIMGHFQRDITEADRWRAEIIQRALDNIDGLIKVTWKVDG